MTIGYRQFGAVICAALLMFVYGAAEAQASWGSFGSGGGSWGGSRGLGSSGGSWGGSRGGRLFGSRGGPVRNLISRVRSNHSRGHGSFGGSRGYASSFGSRGYSSHGGSRGYGSRGTRYSYYSSHGGSVGHASSGGSSGYRTSFNSGSYYSGGHINGQVIDGTTYNSTPQNEYPIDLGYPVDDVFNGGGEVTPPTEVNPILPTDNGDIPRPRPEADQTRTGFQQTSVAKSDTAILNLNVPQDAVVYVNGRRTNTPGTHRSYASRNLKVGRTYTYEVKAEIKRDGETISRTKVVQMSAGNNKSFDMDFSLQKPMITSVTLFVPKDAKVTLGGMETDVTGSMRYFSTNTLQSGQSWEDYKVAVTIEKDGKDVTREQVIDVNAGDSVNLRFDFENDERVASR